MGEDGEIIDLGGNKSVESLYFIDQPSFFALFKFRFHLLVGLIISFR